MADDAQKKLDVEVGQDWVQIQVRVLPRSSADDVAGLIGGSLKIRLTAPALEGKANRALQSFLAKRLHIAKGHVQIISGRTSRIKLVRLYGLSKRDLLLRMPKVSEVEGDPDK